jgi:hypothetical protein
VSERQEGIVAWVGFSEWVRGPARIDGDEIVLDADRAETYMPYEIDESFFMLAAAKDFRDYKAFVRRYGLLWHGPEVLGTGTCRESTSDWRRAVYEAARVALICIKLREAAKVGSAEPVRALGPTWPEVAENLSDEDYLRHVSMGVAGLINKHLAQYPTVLIPAFRFEKKADPGEFVYARQPATLLEALYDDFATIIAQRAELKECPGCGRVFHPKSGRQKYCSESCASTNRWHRWKERQTN